MSYEIEFDRRHDYLVATITGDNSAGTVLGFLDDVIEECHSQDCFHVVIDKRTQGPRLGMNDVFQLVAQGAIKALGVLKAVAVVDPQTGDMVRYAEKLATNRGIHVKAFDTVPEAEEWMRGLDAGEAD